MAGFDAQRPRRHSRTDLGPIEEVETRQTQEVVLLNFPVASGVSERVDELVEEFAQSRPVKHVVIDGFLDENFATKLFEDLPDPDAMPKSRDYMFSDKRELSTLDRHSELSKQLHEVFMSTEFAQAGLAAGGS